MEKLPRYNAFLRKTMCFQWSVNQIFATEDRRICLPVPHSPISLCLSLSLCLPPPASLISWARETAVFSHSLQERIRLNCGIWLSCQNNSKLHTCQPLASWNGKMTEAVFLAFSSWQAHYQLHSPSVHKGLHFSLEALGELSSFTTASNKQLPFEKVGFLAEHGLLPPLRLLPFPSPSHSTDTRVLSPFLAAALHL